MKHTQKNAGIALVIGSFLMLVTMVLHPAGGDFQHLVLIFNIIIISHALAVLSVPFSLVGFWGLKDRLQGAPFLSHLAFAIIAVGLMAAVAAAAINGLALPLFVKRYSDASAATLEAIRPILHYGSALNHAFDFILIGAVCLAVLLWSIAVIVTKRIPTWVGYYGLLLSALAILMLSLGFHFVDLHGFRWFIFGWVSWIIIIGVIMIKSPDVQT